jgi:NAD(P)-dependent dehydrogenase (short-subunit alcohol dehydrogenase family)
MTRRGEGLADKVYVVTGSTQGIGAAVAVALARAGAEGLVICGRNRAGGARVKAAIEAAGAAAAYVAADLGEAADCRAVTAACDARFGRLDGLVNAAGMTDRGTLADTTVELWDRMFAVNTRAPFILMQDAVALMRRAGIAGSIVNVITMSSHGGHESTASTSAGPIRRASTGYRWRAVRPPTGWPRPRPSSPSGA